MRLGCEPSAGVQALSLDGSDTSRRLILLGFKVSGMGFRGILPQFRVGRSFGLHILANCIGFTSGVLTVFFPDLRVSFVLILSRAICIFLCLRVPDFESRKP